MAVEGLEDRALLTVEAALADAIYIIEPGADPVAASQVDQPHVAPFQFSDSNRWNSTFTNGSGLTQGDPTTLRWGIVQDGTSVGTAYAGESSNTSSLIAFMDSLYGDGGISDTGDLTQKPWFSIFNNSLNRLGEVSGLTYSYLGINNQSVTSPTTSTNATLPEVLIGGHSIDGQSGSNILAYNYFPSFGDMVIDTDNTTFFGNSTTSSIGMRNVLMHEFGHGVGIDHVESSDGAFLMEPFVSTAFDGPQLDDILALQRGYGDPLEKSGGNNTAGTATNLGTISSGSTVTKGTKGTTTTVAATDTDFVSIDDESDVDFYKFTVTAASTVSVTLTPQGPTYNQGPQSGTQTSFNAAQQSDLTVQVLSTDGSTVLQTSNTGGLGVAESITNLSIGAAGTYYVKVTGATTDKIQLYRLATSVTAVSTSPTTVALDGSGNLVITDVQSGGLADAYTIQSDATNSRFVISNSAGKIDTSISGSTGSGSNSVTVPFAQVTGSSITINSGDGTDSLTIDLSLGNFSKAITFNGGNPTSGPGDSLTLTGGSMFASVTHTLTSASSGSVAITGNSTISYTGLEPLTDNLSATDRVFTFNGGAETIALTDAAGAAMTIDSDLSEAVTFANPTGSLTINAGSGDDTINITSVDTAYQSDLTINGDAGNDTVALNADITFASGESLIVNAESVSTGAGADLTTSGSGAITFTADDVSLNATSTLVSAGTTTIRPQTASRAIDLGSETGGQLSLTDSEIDRITAGTLVIGNASSGAITISAAISAAAATNVTLISGGAITATESIAPNGGNLTLTAGGAITQGPTSIITATTLTTSSVGGTTLASASNNVTTLSATNTGSGNVVYVDANAFSVSGSNLAGNFSATATTNAITVTASNVSASGSITLTADDMTLTGTVTGSSSITLQPATLDTTIGLNDATGALALSTAELQKLSTPMLVIGNSIAGNMTIGSLGSVDLSSRNFSSVTLNSPTLTFNEPTGSGLVLPNNATLQVNQIGAVVSSTSANTTDIVIGGSGTLDINVTSPLSDTFGDDTNPVTTSIAFLKGNSGEDVFLSEADTVQIPVGQSYSTNGRTLTMKSGTLQLTASGQIGDTTQVAVSGPSASFDIGTFNESLEAIVLEDGSVIGTTGTITAALDTYATKGLFSAKLAGPGTLRKSLAGTLRMTNANTFSGGAVLTDGELVVENDAALGTGTIRFDSNATLRSGGPAPATRTLANAMSLSSQWTATIDAPTGFPLVINGTVSSDDNTATIIKTGAASLTLAGNGSGFTSTITASAGALIVNGAFANTTSTTVASGATLGGTGSLGPVSVQSGGHLSPGSSPAILDTGNLSLTSGSEVVIEIGGTTPGDAATNHDQLNVTGTVDLGGATLTLSTFNGYVPTPGSQFVIVNNDSNDAITGTFNGLAEGASISNFLGSSLTATISYIGGTGNDAVISIPDAVSVAVSPASVAESGSGILTYTFSRGLTSGAITVDFTVGGTATFGTDYTQTGATSFAAATGSVTIPDGSSSVTITIDPTADSTVELDETVILTLLDGATYDIASPTAATGTITNDDSAVINVTASTATEGSNVVYTVTLSNPVDVDVAVSFSTLMTGTATSGADFNAITNQTVTFAANTTTSQTVDVAALNDTLVESSQTVVGQLSALSASSRNVTLTGGGASLSATGTITDADSATVAFQSASSTAGEDAGAHGVVLVLTTAAGNTLENSASFSISATNGSAENADYDQGSFPKTVTFAAGSGNSATRSVNITPASDTLVEGDETVTLTTSVSSGVTTLGAQATHTVTITDADTASVAFQSATSTLTEDGGAQNVVLVLTTAAGNTLENSATFSIAATNGTASNADYNNASFPKTVTFAASSGNATTQSFSVTPTSDTLIEGSETLTLTATVSTGVATLGSQSTNAVTITDADTATVAFQSASSTAGEEGGAHAVTLVLTTAPGNTLVGSATFRINATNGTASNSDYDNASFPKTVTFAASSGNGTTQTVSLVPTSDTTLEGDETVTLTVSLSTGVATLGTQTTHVVTITSDEVPSDVYVDDDWAGLAYGVDPDGAGPAVGFGIDAFATIQGGVNAVATAGTVHVYSGPYVENVSIAKNMTVDGVFGTATLPEADAVILDPVGGNGFTISAPATSVILSDMTITGAVNGVVASGAVNLTLTNVLSTNHSTTGLGFTSTGDLTINGGTFDGIECQRSEQRRPRSHEHHGDRQSLDQRHERDQPHRLGRCGQ